MLNCCSNLEFRRIRVTLILCLYLVVHICVCLSSWSKMNNHINIYKENNKSSSSSSPSSSSCVCMCAHICVILHPLYLLFLITAFPHSHKSSSEYLRSQSNTKCQFVFIPRQVRQTDHYSDLMEQKNRPIYGLPCIA
jgi:hypothetical protein